jgi:hypothetical protein
MTQRERFGANRPRWLHLHPMVGRLAVALIVWAVGAVWVLFGSYEGPLLYGIVTFLVLTFVALPWTLLRFLRRKGEAAQPSTFKDWTGGRFDTASGSIEAGEAAIMILLVPLAVAIGVTGLGLVRILTVLGVL